MASQSKRLSKTYTRLRRGHAAVGDVLYSRGGSFGPRIQRDFQLVAIHHGFLTLTLDGEVLEVPENHAILLSPGHTEHFRFAHDCETRHSWVALAPDIFGTELQAEFVRSRGPFPFVGRVASLLDIARQDRGMPPRDKLNNRYLEALAISILCAFAASVRGVQDHFDSSQMILWRMDSFLAASYPLPITLAEVAHAAGASRQHLLTLCRLSGRPTPIRQLYSKRLEAAAELMIHTGLSLAEIACQCGFANQFHFSRRFRQSFGKSPSAWRTRTNGLLNRSR